MNPLQKAWLVALKPVVTFVNEKMATRSGIVGKLGRFFSFGPRQFGYHPINRLIFFANNLILEHVGLSLHRYSIIKHLGETGNIRQRPYSYPALLGMIITFGAMFYLVVPKEFMVEDGTSLEYLTERGVPAHYSSLNHRVSAHYTEINSLYGYQMKKKIDQKMKEITRKRAAIPDKIKKTRFARPGYDYIEAHTNAN